MTVRPTPEQRAEMAAYIDATEPGLLDDIPRQECVPSGCQCSCHSSVPGITIAHLVPCCPGYTTVHDEPRTW